MMKIVLIMVILSALVTTGLTLHKANERKENKIEIVPPETRPSVGPTIKPLLSPTSGIERKIRREKENNFDD